MKILLRFISVLTLTGIYSLGHARQAITQEEGRQPKKSKRLDGRDAEGGVFMKEGQMMTLKDGTAQPMTAPMTLNDGTKVALDGSVTMADGKTLMLHNGQYLRPDGSLLDQGSLRGKGLNKRSL